MGLKVYKPYTPSRRFMTGYSFEEITKTTPEKKLTTFIGKSAGRNNQGRVTVRFRGGGHKKLYRILDFRGYDKANIPAKVASIEYDPYRTARIALLQYADGEKRYVLAWQGVKVGADVMAGEQAKIAAGNRKMLKDIPEGYNVFNLELVPNSKGKLFRSAGSFGTLTGREETKHEVYIKLPSGEVRKFNENCWATIGQVGNEDHKNMVIGKAGRQRWLGKKPHVLGKSMNPCDHPHGGGEGHTAIALKYQKSFSGVPVPPGKKTRSSKKYSNCKIVSRRTRNG